ncbi:MAG: 16S rRNA (uracil(1498)-N(3))-methyltransferase [Clostridiales bacterium]|jgi:16S rRNA (uracil1498-N3)-methyltransferase|nr:16S rRNA (uracil(1498)-N(3))-methyltransferase [Clostridiales bacterium]
MNCFYSNRIVGDLARLSDEDARHALKSLRLKTGDTIVLVVDGQRYAAVLEARGGEVFARTTVPLPGTEPGVRVTLYQGLPKGERMDDIVRRCTEAGVYAVAPCIMARSVARPDEAARQARRTRWQKVAREAAMQSGRTIVPEIRDFLASGDIRTELQKHEQALVAWEEATENSLRRVYRGVKDVAIVIGPEGGISRDEILDMRATPFTLGPRIFRTETAGLAAIVSLFTLTGDTEYGQDRD